MKLNIDKLQAGSEIVVQTWGEGLRLGIVENVDYDEGLPVAVGYVDADGEGWWCDFDQIVRVVSY